MCQPHKMIKHTQTIHQQIANKFLSAFDHFVGLARKKLIRNTELLVFVGCKSSLTHFKPVLH